MEQRAVFHMTGALRYLATAEVDIIAREDRERNRIGIFLCRVTRIAYCSSVLMT
jgi:hypothetical protein